ncbi:MAG: 50S ribosomal protein L10 [Candidatus Aenigmarchaeota archaeon]|nr:50S ribosomal protein L10 [Candidatus Aenigmarchaeota archaeon]
MRQDVPQWKIEKVEEIYKLIESYPVVSILNLKGLPASALQKIKNDLKSEAKIKVVKKSILKRALEKSTKKQLLDYLDVQPALLLTNTNPFKIYNKIYKSKSDMPAKPGQIAEKDIEVKAGPTELMPGPAITALSKVGIPAKVEGGKIAIIKDKVVLKAGEVVSPELASALTMLGMKPMKVGLDVHAILENGIVYQKDVLYIDPEKTLNDIMSAVQAAFNLSVNAGIVTKDNVELMIIKAFNEAKNLSLEAGIVSKEIVGDLLAKAVREMKTLEEKIGELKIENNKEGENNG